MGSFLKRWLSAYRISKIGSNIACGWRWNFVVRCEEGICFRLTQFGEHWHIIRTLVRAPNVSLFTPTRSVLCWGTSQWFRALPRFAQLSKSVSPNPKIMLHYDLTRWLISSHVGSLFQFWLCTCWMVTIVTRLASPLRMILVVKRGQGLGFISTQLR